MEPTQLRAQMADCTAGWTVVCETYLREHTTTTTTTVAAAACDDDETRRFQQKGFEYMAAMEAWETELARLEARVPFVPG